MGATLREGGDVVSRGPPVGSTGYESATSDPGGIRCRRRRTDSRHAGTTDEGVEPVGILGYGRDETVEASDATAVKLRTAKDAGALERAALPAEGGLSGAATRLVERLLDVGIDGKGPFDPAHE